jgi:hypothetical protein
VVNTAPDAYDKVDTILLRADLDSQFQDRLRLLNLFQISENGD